MRKPRSRLRFFLDEGVPISAGKALEGQGHEVIYFNQSGVAKGSSDPMVALAAQLNKAVLVALDGDMKTLAKGHGVSNATFKSLSLLKLSCRESRAADRITEAMSLIEHEWTRGKGRDRRLFVDIGNEVLRSHR